MRAKETIRKKLSELKSKNLSLFEEAAKKLFPDKPSAGWFKKAVRRSEGLNSTAITSAVKGSFKDKKAQALVDYFHPRFQQLIAVEQLLKAMPDINETLESGENVSGETIVADIIQTICDSGKEFAPDGYEKKLENTTQKVEQIKTEAQKLSTALDQLDFTQENFLGSFKQINENLQNLTNSISSIEKEIDAIVKSINNSVENYRSPKGVSQEAITDYLPLRKRASEKFQNSLTNFTSIPNEFEAHKNFKESLENSDQAQQKFVADLNKDLQQRDQFYLDFNKAYTNSEEVMVGVNEANAHAATLKNEVKQLETSTTQSKTRLDEKNKIYEQTIRQKAIQTEFNQLVRKKLALMKVNVQEIHDIHERNIKLKEIITSASILIENLNGLQKEVVQQEYKTALDLHVAELNTCIENNKKLQADINENIVVVAEVEAASITPTVHVEPEAIKKDISSFEAALRTQYAETLQKAAKGKKEVNKVIGFGFNIFLENFKETSNKSQQKIILSEDDRLVYIGKLLNHIKSRNSLRTTLFRDTVLTKQKEVIGNEAMTFFRDFESAEQLLNLVDLAINWNNTVEEVAGKEYWFKGTRFEMKSGLERVLKEIKADLEKKLESPQLEVLPQSPSLGTS